MRVDLCKSSLLKLVRIRARVVKVYIGLFEVKVSVNRETFVILHMVR